MRIHSDIITADDIRAALQTEKLRGRIAGHVTFKRLTEHRSSVRTRAFEIQLEAMFRDNGRRAGNSGSYGAMRPESDGYAATFDEWGWLLAELYRLDADMLTGEIKHPVYPSEERFHEDTGWTYQPEKLIDAIETTGDPFPIVVGNAARSKRGYLIGRRGANRVRVQPSYWPGKIQPRTADEVRETLPMTTSVEA